MVLITGSDLGCLGANAALRLAESLARCPLALSMPDQERLDVIFEALEASGNTAKDPALR